MTDILMCGENPIGQVSEYTAGETIKSDSIAPVESLVSLHAYAKDDLLVYNGELYIATSAIAVGDTITSKIERTTTTSYVNPTRMNNIETNIGILSKATGVEYSNGVSVKDMLDKVPFSLSAESGVTVSSTDTKCTAIGNLVTISALFTLTSTTTAKNFTLASIPSEYKPSYTVACHAVDNTNDIAVSGLIDNNGNIKIYRNGTQSLSTIRFTATYVTS